MGEEEEPLSGESCILMINQNKKGSASVTARRDMIGQLPSRFGLRLLDSS